MKPLAHPTTWKIILTTLAVVGLITYRVYEQKPHFRLLKSTSKTVPADVALVEYLPPNVKNVKLKMTASERAGRPLDIRWLDHGCRGDAIDIERGKAGVLCDHGDLANGIEFVLMPGHYRLRIELAVRERRQNRQPFHINYSLYEFR